MSDVDGGLQGGLTAEAGHQAGALSARWPGDHTSSCVSNYSYPPCTLTDEETRTEMLSRELQTAQREKQEILAFEGHLAAASTKQTITESSSLLLSQLTSLDPQYELLEPIVQLLLSLGGAGSP